MSDHGEVMERPINIGPVRLDVHEKIVIGPHGGLDTLTNAQVKVLLSLAKAKLNGRTTWLAPAHIASSALVSETTVANCVVALNKALGAKSITNKSTYGYRLEMPVSWCEDENVGATTSTLPRLEHNTPRGFADLARSLRPISPEIEAFGERHGITTID